MLKYLLRMALPPRRYNLIQRLQSAQYLQRLHPEETQLSQQPAVTAATPGVSLQDLIILEVLDLLETLRHTRQTPTLRPT